MSKNKKDWSTDSGLLARLGLKEGIELKVYPDMVKQEDGTEVFKQNAIGHGSNFDSPSNQRWLRSKKYDIEKLRSGEESITEEHAKELKMKNVKEAQIAAERIFPDFHSHPDNVQKSLVEMAFQIAPAELNTWDNTKAAIANKDYEAAARHALDSKWARFQTTKRALEVAAQIAGHKVEIPEGELPKYVPGDTPKGVIEPDGPAPAEPTDPIDFEEPAEPNQSRPPVSKLLEDMLGGTAQAAEAPKEDPAEAPEGWHAPMSLDSGLIGKSEPAEDEYEVKEGDTLSKIAQRFNLDWKELAKINNLDNPDLIFPDQKIKLGRAKPDRGLLGGGNWPTKT